MNNKIKFLSVVSSVAFGISAFADPAFGSFDWKTLPGTYKNTFGKCTYTKSTSQPPAEREFVPASATLQITALNVDDLKQQAEGQEPNALLVGGAILQNESAVLSKFNQAKTSNSELEGEAKPCNIITTAKRAYTSVNGVFAFKERTHPNCQNQNVTVRARESLELGLGGDGVTLTVIVERDDEITKKHTGYACRYIKQP